VEGISDLFGPLVQQYQSLDELRALIDRGLHAPSLSREDLDSARAIGVANSFKARARTISDFMTSSYEEICQQRLVAPQGPR